MELLEKIYEHICNLLLQVSDPEGIKLLTDALMTIEALKTEAKK